MFQLGLGILQCCAKISGDASRKAQMMSDLEEQARLVPAEVEKVAAAMDDFAETLEKTGADETSEPVAEP